MFLSTHFYSIENRVRIKLTTQAAALKLASGSEDSGLEHYMAREVDGQLQSHLEEIGVVWNQRFARKLSKKVLIQLWDVVQFLDNSFIRGCLAEFLLTNERKYHLDQDVAFKARFESKAYHSLYLQEKLSLEQSYLDNICGNRYTLADNKTHLTLLEILQNLNFQIGVKKLGRPKKLQRHKGYRDHGSLPDESTKARRKGVSEDFNLTQLQLKKEQEEKELSDALELLKGWLM